MHYATFVFEGVACIDCLPAVLIGMGLFFSRIEEVRIFRPCGESDIGNLGMEPEVSIFLGTEGPRSIIWKVCAFAESHLIVVVFWEEGTVKLSFDCQLFRSSVHSLVYHPGMDIHLGDRGVGFCPILATRGVVVGLMNRVGRVLVEELLDSSSHDSIGLSLEKNECAYNRIYRYIDLG